ncbi:mannitol dehydrogenase family protein [Novosphingobium sp. B 225]|uniref:mannitol dehydrogenase family protein n=1 Tax=Novosphingobium sp. B 225 TaxID=1961849 RepID=UPI000B4B585F|nr:mannitol dehydrogenase family protein [Novosphingobium sp. B 225]
MRLASATVSHLGPGVERPGYDRDAQAVGVVHIGIGAFHRAHQAWYTDRAMAAGDRDWAITGVSLRSDEVARQLNPQDGLYTVTERSAAGSATRVVAAVRRVLVAGQDSAVVIAALAAPQTRIVSFTVTEKGYCRAADGNLDLGQADQGSFYPLLAQALRRRRDAGLPGLTLLSCDNLADNGRQLERLMGEYLDRHDPALTGWFQAECACPSTMVDRIVPATTAADRAELAARTGLDDQGAVMTEPFSQWVIEDRFAGPRPRWERVGAQLVQDVRAYETAKLRMLNGAHSLLAYCGLAREHAYVHEAIGDPVLLALVRQLLLEEAAPSIAAAPGQDLARYTQDLLTRFANPALNHRLIQIAMDGSQKLPQRWLETLSDNQQQGRSCPAIETGIADWIRHLRGANGPVDDPRAAALAGAAAQDDALTLLFGPGGPMASAWQPGG